MQIIDSPRAAAIQMRDPRAALAAGELQTDNVTALEKFDRAFSFSPEAIERARIRNESQTGQPSVHLKNATPFVFQHLLDEAFIGGDASTETIHFHVIGDGEYTVRFDAENLEVAAGRLGSATAQVVTSRETFGGMTLFKVKAASAAAEAHRARLEDSVGRELDDTELALVAGGKGSDPVCVSLYDCGGDILVVGCRSDGGCDNDYCAGDACYADHCGADACAGDACGGDGGGFGGCSADACGGAACTGDACGAAGCAGDACGGGAACMQDLCGLDACGADYCGADACGAAACGADLCPIDACLADACLANLLPIPGPFQRTEG